jgi:hypothetical protein
MGGTPGRGEDTGRERRLRPSVCTCVAPEVLCPRGRKLGAYIPGMYNHGRCSAWQGTSAGCGISCLAGHGLKFGWPMTWHGRWDFRSNRKTNYFFLQDGSRTVGMKPCRNPSASSAGPCTPSPSPSCARPMLASTPWLPSLVATCCRAARCTLLPAWAVRSVRRGHDRTWRTAPLGPVHGGVGAYLVQQVHCSRGWPSRCAGCQTRAPSCACPSTPQPWSRFSNRGVGQQPRADRPDSRPPKIFLFRFRRNRAPGMSGPRRAKGNLVR